VPWHFKYTSEGICGQRCKHGGVETEWESMKVFTAFNAYSDADACCIGSMANAAFYQHAPLPELLQRAVPPAPNSLADLEKRGYVTKKAIGSGYEVVKKVYAAYYAGDYDAAAWLYSQLRPNWDDGGRGKTPIGWAVNSGTRTRTCTCTCTINAINSVRA
jgi:hypothetical protein